MCVLLCARLQVPNLVFRRAFRGGSLQIRDTVDDNATVVCFLDLHVIAPPPDINTYPEVDLWL
jgi:hypothetical protein